MNTRLLGLVNIPSSPFKMIDSDIYDIFIKSDKKDISKINPKVKEGLITKVDDKLAIELIVELS